MRQLSIVTNPASVGSIDAEHKTRATPANPARTTRKMP